MPQQEEVNAWASYEQTARTPRRFANALRQRHTQQLAAHSHHGATALLSQSRHTNRPNLSQSCHPSIDLAAIGIAEPYVHSPRQKFFQEALSQELGQSSRHGGGTWSIHDDEEGSAAAKNHTDLDVDILEKIRTTFNVFFEGGYHVAEKEVDRQNQSHSLKKLFQSLNATMPWTQTSVQSPILFFLDLCLRGVGQVVFQNSPLTGFFILVGLYIQSARVAIHGTLAVTVTNALALLLGFDKGLAGSGLFGYNALLVGLALATFDSQQEYNAATLIASVAIASFTSILFVMMGKLLVPYKSPPLTLPFNVATLLFLLSTAHMGRVDYGSVRIPSLPEYNTDGGTNFTITASQFFAGTIRGLGQVYLADHLAAGFLVLTGMAVCSRISAFAAVAGSAMGAAMAAVEAGLYGFNSSLSVTVMFMFYTPSVGAGILAVMAGAMTVVAQQALATMLAPWGLPFMTLPFCVVSLPFIIIQGTTSIVVAVPEDHLKVMKMLADGFAFLKEALEENGLGERSSSSRESTRYFSKLSTRSSSNMHSRKLTKSLSLLSEALDEADEAHGSSGYSKARTTDKKRHGFGSFKEDLQHEETKKVALEIFQALLQGQDENGKPLCEVTLSHIIHAFQEAGLYDEEALNFAVLILTLIDLDESTTIDKAEFVCFALVCRAMCTIRTKIVKFFDFVDEDGNGNVSFEEMDSALQYLGQPLLDDVSKERLLELTRNHGKLQAVAENDAADDAKEEMDIMELVNVVTVGKVKAFTSAFHGCGTTASLTNYNVCRDGMKGSKKSMDKDSTDRTMTDRKAEIDC